MEVIKRHKAIATFTIAIMSIVFIFFAIFSMRDNGTFYLKDLQGDRTVLSDIVVSGYLQDRYHGQKFEIIDGKMVKSCLYYDDFNDVKKSPIRYANGADDGEFRYWYQYSYEISPSANKKVEYSENKIQQEVSNKLTDATEKITTTYADKIDVYMKVGFDWLNWEKKKPYPDKNYLKFKTGVYVESNAMDFTFQNKKVYHTPESFSEQDTFLQKNEMMQRYGNALTVKEGKPYFTVLTDKQYKGKNGIYTVKEYGSLWSWDTNNNGHAKAVVNFSLEKNNTEVLGLHMVNDQLALILLVDDVLTFRTYHPQNGDLLAELTVDELPMQNDKIKYDAYIEDNTLNLNIVTQEDDIDLLTIVSVEIGDTISLLHCVDRLKFDGQIIHSVQCIAPTAGKLVVVAGTKDIDTYITNKQLYGKHFNILVFDDISNKTKLLYQGEIITDANQDIHRYRYTLDKNFYDLRDLANVKVRRK